VSTTPPRLAPLLAQLDMSLDLAVQRMTGLTDDEFWWRPTPSAVTVVRDEHGKLVPGAPADNEPRTRTIALLLGHLGEMGFRRADYTTGEHSLTRRDLTWPDSAEAGLTFLREGWAAWRAALTSLQDAELDVVGRSAFPDGMDPNLPILDIIWWMNRELIHHTAEIAFVRDLYANWPE
jgi:hypothetical protein